MTTECPPEALAEVLALADESTDLGLNRVSALIADYGADARLHFLQGSLLASVQRYEEAHAAMSQAVILQPDYDLARFQLGLLELSSNRPDLADATLAPFEQRPSNQPLRLLSEGLRLLIVDDLVGAVGKLKTGIALDPGNEAINRDMQLLIAELERTGPGPADDRPTGEPEAAEEEITSPAQLMLQQFGRKPTRH